MRYFGLVAIAAAIAVVFLFAVSPVDAQSSLSISFDPASVVSKGNGSDQWHMAWSSDGNIYSAWGDGSGWDSSGNCFLGITRISGTAPNYSGLDLFCQPRPSSTDIKPYGLYSVGNTLYLFYCKKGGSPGCDAQTLGGKSTNSGSSFTLGAVVAGSGKPLHPGPLLRPFPFL